MGWRKTQSDVQSGRVSFAKPKDNFRGFANAANIIAKSWMQDAADEKEAEKLRLKEEKAERKRIRNAQAAAETKDKKLRSNATILAETYTGDPNNKPVVDYFYQQLVLKDGNIGSVETATQARIKDGQLEFTAGTTETVSVPFQGPNVPADPKIADLGVGFGSDGTVETGSNVDPLGTTSQTGEDFRVSDIDKIAADESRATDLWSGQAKEMQEIFAERGTPLDGTTLPEDGTKEVTTEAGVKITPYGQQTDKLDYSRLDTLRHFAA
mgnify:FL=1